MKLIIDKDGTSITEELLGEVYNDELFQSELTEEIDNEITNRMRLKDKYKQNKHIGRTFGKGQ
jgi:hypothetical protein